MITIDELHAHKKDSGRVIAWFSGGVASALACYWAVNKFGDRCEVVFQDTKNEDPDTYRFMKECSDLYKKPIIRITNEEYNNIEEVWFKFLSLRVATGAICSSELKRRVREAYQNPETDYAQIFGFDSSEGERHHNMRLHYPEINVISPLVMFGYSKEYAINFFEVICNIRVPQSYYYGYRNNNCLETGCVQGGIGYWKKYQIDFPARFDKMAKREHRLTDLKGEPVTICKDQSKTAKESGNVLVFLKPHPNYPNVKDLSMMKGRQPEPLIECNGFCGTKD